MEISIGCVYEQGIRVEVIAAGAHSSPNLAGCVSGPIIVVIQRPAAPMDCTALAGCVRVENVVLDGWGAARDVDGSTPAGGTSGRVLIEGIVQDASAAAIVEAAALTDGRVGVNQRVPEGQIAAVIIDGPAILVGVVVIEAVAQVQGGGSAGVVIEAATLAVALGGVVVNLVLQGHGDRAGVVEAAALGGEVLVDFVPHQPQSVAVVVDTAAVSGCIGPDIAVGQGQAAAGLEETTAVVGRIGVEGDIA